MIWHLWYQCAAMTAPNPHISVVAPTYRCEECLPELYRRLRESLGKLDENFEIIFVNDGSPDGDWDVIRQLAGEDSRVKGLNFSRNFGQHRAITAGIDHAAGDWVVVMDADLQDQPEEIVKLYRTAVDEGHDVVFGRRIQRRDNLVKIAASRAFNAIFNQLSDITIEPTIGNFSIASRQVMDSYRSLRESNRSHCLQLLWCGYRVGYVDVEHAARYAGETTYDLRRSVGLAIAAVISQSDKPMRLSIKFGFFMSALSFLSASYLAIRRLLWAIPVSGWTSIMVSMCFLAGLVLMNLGIIGLYIGRIFDETKRRPMYIIRDQLNLARDDTN